MVETARQALGGPLEVLAALGHGRSYGISSTVLVRSLPGITECGLWTAIERSQAARTFALLTDIGNDIAYGIAPERIAAWVDSILERLAMSGARTVLTLLPLERLADLSVPGYVLIRSILFPRSRVSLRETLARASELDLRLREIASRRGASIVEPERAWYGLDPIHIRRRLAGKAWRTILGAWSLPGPVSAAEPSLTRWLALRLALPERCRLAGLSVSMRQPACRLPDGTTVGYY